MNFSGKKVKVYDEKFGRVDVCGASALKLTCTVKPKELTMLYAEVGSFEADAENSVEIEFCGQSVEKYGELTVQLVYADGTVLFSYRYDVLCQKSRYNIPFFCPKKGLYTIKFLFGSTEQSIIISDLSAKNMGNTKLSTLESGVRMCDGNWKSFELADKSEISQIKCLMDITMADGYLYAIGGGNLYVLEADASGTAPRLVGMLENLGSVRQIVVIPNKNAVAVTARQDGVYMIDVTDKCMPKIVGRYDSLEFATGVDVSGNYMFVTNRVFGTEIVDIRNIKNPVFCSSIKGGEAQSCYADGKYLYIGYWAERYVGIYDVLDVYHVKKLSEAKLDGKGDGVFVHKNILYAATGQHWHDGLTDCDVGKGMGNGMEIFDISNKNEPVQLSGMKIDGRYFYMFNDTWKVRIAEDKTVGKIYAYWFNAYVGIYVCDVTNPANPLRICHITVKIEKGSPNYDISTHQKIPFALFPYDINDHLQSPVVGIALAEGVMYIAANETGLHMYRDSYKSSIAHNVVEKRQFKEENRGKKTEDTIDGALSVFRCGGQVYAAAVQDGYVYAACGLDGLCILDTDLRLIKKAVDCGIVSDVKLNEGYLYSANGSDGLKIYECKGDELRCIGEYISYDENGINPVKQILLSPNANFALLHSGAAYTEIVDLRNKNAPIRINRFSAVGLMYYRQLSSTLIANRYAAATWHLGEMLWFDFGLDDGNEPIIIRDDIKNRFSMDGCYCGFNDSKIAVLAEDSLIFYDPTDKTIKDVNALPRYTVKDLNGKIVNVRGKAICKNNILYLSERATGVFSIIDVSDIKNPILMQRYVINGSPDVAYAGDGYVLLPAGHSGLIKYTI